MISLMFFRNGVSSYRLWTESQTQANYPQGSQLSNYILYGLECDPRTDFTIADCSFEPNVQWFNAQQCISR